MPDMPGFAGTTQSETGSHSVAGQVSARAPAVTDPGPDQGKEDTLAIGKGTRVRYTPRHVAAPTRQQRFETGARLTIGLILVGGPCVFMGWLLASMP
jgi:hypothetical protein